MIENTVTTTSGTKYEFCVKDGVQKVRRLGGEGMRRDEEWLTVFNMKDPEVGEPLLMVLEPLGEGSVTFRSTTPVTAIE